MKNTLRFYLPPTLLLYECTWEKEIGRVTCVSNIAILPLYAKKDLGTGQTDVTPLFFGKIVFFPFKKSMWEYEIKHFFKKGGEPPILLLSLYPKNQSGVQWHLFYKHGGFPPPSERGCKKSNRPIIFWERKSKREKYGKTRGWNKKRKGVGGAWVGYGKSHSISAFAHFSTLSSHWSSSFLLPTDFTFCWGIKWEE